MPGSSTPASAARRMSRSPGGSPSRSRRARPGRDCWPTWRSANIADHLPLYRQEGIFKRFGVELSRSTVCDWMAACAGLLEPIVAAMTRRILLSKVIATDDTPVKVQDHTPGKGIKTGSLWVYLGDLDNPFIVYDYRPDRTGDGPERFLKGYKSGYLQSDAYSGYDAIHARGIIEVGCWAHAGGSSTMRGPATRSGRTPRSPGSAGFTASRATRRSIGSTPPRDTSFARNDRGRSWNRSGPGWKARRPRCCPKARSARRSHIHARTGRRCRVTSKRISFRSTTMRARTRSEPIAVGPEELAVLRQRPGRPDGGDLDEPDVLVQVAGGRAIRLSSRRARSGEHTPEQPDRRAAPRPLGEAGVGGHARPNGIDNIHPPAGCDDPRETKGWAMVVRGGSWTRKVQSDARAELDAHVSTSDRQPVTLQGEAPATMHQSPELHGIGPRDGRSVAASGPPLHVRPVHRRLAWISRTGRIRVRLSPRLCIA